MLFRSKEIDEYEGPDNWEENPVSKRISTAKELANLAGAIHMPHVKIKEAAMISGEPISTKAQAKVSMGGPMPQTHSALQSDASKRVVQRDKADQAMDKQQQKQQEQQIKQRQTDAAKRQKAAETIKSTVKNAPNSK